MKRFNFTTLLSRVFLAELFGAAIFGAQDPALMDGIYHPSSQLALVTKRSADFESMADIKTEDLSRVREIDLSGSKDVSRVIHDLALNATLRNLISVNLSDTNVSLSDLEELRNIRPELGFIRPMERISGRFGNQVACIEVNIGGTELVKNDKVRWELNNDIQIPVERTARIFYLATREWAWAHLQILLNK